jgi:hypothetical protein
MSAFLGMRGTGNWETDERPKSWREGILKLYPNGDAPLTALMSKLSESKVDDPEYNWWTQTFPAQAGAILGIYTDAALGTALAAAGTSGQALYVKVAEAVADEIRPGHQVLLRDESDQTVDVNAKVTNVVKNGADSVISITLLEADDNSSHGHDLRDADRILVIGSINAEGASMPEAIAYNPTKIYNYTQIFRNSLSITRTARRTRLRTGDAYKRAKKECLEMHSVEMEKAFMFGIRTENTGSNGKPERTSMGLIPFIKTYAADRLFDYANDTDYASKSWIEGGEDWLDTALETLFRYGSQEKMVFAGSGAILGINKLVKSLGNFEFNAKTVSYGIKVVEWVTPFGVIYLKTHPLFSYEQTTRNCMVAFEPKELSFRYVDDTTFYGEDDKKNTGRTRIDGTDEEYLTEAGLEFHHPIKCGFFSNVGVDNTLAG